MTEYNKLVRDKIPDIIMQKGQVPVIHIANDAEYEQKLLDKLDEEVAEFKTSRSPEELADILEVIYTLCGFISIKRYQVENLRQQKVLKKGSFSKRIVLERVAEEL